MKLYEAIHSVPASLFPTIDGQRRPNYSKIFTAAVSAILEARNVKYDPQTLEAVANNVNLSSFQRAVASEAARRYGQMVDGERVPSTIKETKPAAPKKVEKKAKPAAPKAPRGVDPITGEKKAPKKAKPVPKVEKVEKVEKAEKKASASKKAAPAPKKAVPTVDPITGEPLA